MYTTINQIGPVYRFEDMRRQAHSQQQRLLNIISGTREMTIDFEQYKKPVKSRNSQFNQRNQRSKSLLRHNDYSQSKSFKTKTKRMNKTYNFNSKNTSRERSKHVRQKQKIRNIRSINPSKTQNLFKLQRNSEDQILAKSSSNNGTHRLRMTLANPDSTLRNKSVSSVDNNHKKSINGDFKFAIPDIKYPLTFHTEAALKGQKKTRRMAKLRKSNSKNYNNIYRKDISLSSKKLNEENHTLISTKITKEATNQKKMNNDANFNNDSYHSIFKSSSKKSNMTDKYSFDDNDDQLFEF